MPSFRDVYGQYINSDDVRENAITAQIVEIGPERMNSDSRDSGKRKLVCRLDGIEKQFVINRTNAEKMCKEYGDDYAKWAGMTITLSLGKTLMGGKWVDCVECTPRSKGVV